MKTPSIDSIELINADAVMFVCHDEDSAKQYLKRNPRCQVVRDENLDSDERVALIYSLAECNLLNAVKRV